MFDKADVEFKTSLYKLKIESRDKCFRYNVQLYADITTSSNWETKLVNTDMYIKNLQIVHTHGHDQQIPRRLCTSQTMAHTSLSWFLLPYSDSCSCYTMENALKQSTMVFHSY